MLASNFEDVPWPDCGEIDVMEFLGHEPYKVHGSMHGPGYSAGDAVGGFTTVDDDGGLPADFHVFGVEWDENSITWLLDGEPYQTITPADLPNDSPWVFDHPPLPDSQRCRGRPLARPTGRHDDVPPIDARRLGARLQPNAMTTTRRLIPLLLFAALVVTSTAGCVRKVARAPDGVLVVAQEQQASWVRNFNPLTTATAPRWPTLAGVYEPMFVFNSVTSQYVPWLAVEREWRDGNRTLRVTTRDGVKWSDGEAFTARDVAFTFSLLKEFPALDRRGVWEFIDGVRAVDARTVDFSFSRVFIPGFDELAAQQIVPEHVWSEVEDPVMFTNENPVATGPFTEVRIFRNQVFEIGRNPHYWQEGLPKFEAIRCPAYPSNDRANLALCLR